MPVWYEATKDAREKGTLRVVGITQEQHPARCRLFARWQGIDMPILSDPFNLTRSKAVPNFTLVDEHGVVRVPGARPQDLAAFLAKEYASPERDAPEADGASDVLMGFLRDRGADPTPLIEALTPAKGDPARDFRRGVAYRMRHDSKHAEAGDFQAAVHAWQAALRARPDQYIWRRRLQQYGPLTDKPYPFYDWIEPAQAALVARGETPEVLDAALTLSERSLPAADGEARKLTASPDPQSKLPADGDGLLRVETALVFDTKGRRRVARLHVSVRPSDARRATWNGATDPLALWIDAPEGISVEPRGLALDLAGEARGEIQTFELDVEVPGNVPGGTSLRVHVFAPVCRSDDGTCLYVRKTVGVPLPR